MTADATTALANDALLAPWTGPHGGFPRFDQVDPAAMRPALEEGMARYRAEIAGIAGRTEPATFDNTILALEDAGRPFNRAASLFGVYTSTMNDRAMQATEAEMAPILAGFSDEIAQNTALFARLAAVHAAREGLEPDQRRLVELVYQGFARRGAALGAEAKARMTAINGRLATLFTRFAQNVLADEETQAHVVRDPDQLSGVPDTLRHAARQPDGSYRFANTRSVVEPLLALADDRALREAAYRMFTTRGEHAGPTDNRPVIAEILALRAERAGLLGFASHAHWVLADNMAGTPDAAMALMRRVWPAAVARAREEIAAMEALAGGPIAAWDYRYYAEKVRAARYDLDPNAVKPYLQLDRMRDAMFWVAEQLLGMTFTRLEGVPVVHPDVTVYEVTRGADRVGLWYFDPYARDGKLSGAWMSEYRTQERWRERITPIVSNNSNFVKGSPGEPVSISWDDAVTMFHEFGHALHGLDSDVRYPTLAGTNVKRDFVEFPSQLNERWLPTPEVLSRFARHATTGEVIPDELVRKLERAKHAGEGFRTVEYLAAAIFDMVAHTSPPAADVGELEARVLRELDCPREIAMRHRPTHFGHIFAGDGYSAGYYSYIWADTLTADAAEAFVEAGSFYDRATAARLHAQILSAGNSVAPEVAFRTFRGRDVDTDALMRDRGFPVPGPANG